MKILPLGAEFFHADRRRNTAKLTSILAILRTLLNKDKVTLSYFCSNILRVSLSLSTDIIYVLSFSFTLLFHYISACVCTCYRRQGFTLHIAQLSYRWFRQYINRLCLNLFADITWWSPTYVETCNQMYMCKITYTE